MGQPLKKLQVKIPKSTASCDKNICIFLKGFIKNYLDAILEARYGSISGHRKQRRSRTAFSAQQLQALERAFETTQVQ